MDVGTIVQQLGVAGAIVAFAVWVILDMRKERAEKDALIASKDKTVELAVVALAAANARAEEFPKLLGQVSGMVTDLGAALAVVRDRDRG